MVTTDMQLLKEKLARFAGLTKVCYYCEGTGRIPTGHWNPRNIPDSTNQIDIPRECPKCRGTGNTLETPDFTSSLDACFKHLVPKLEPLGYDLEIANDLEMFGWSVCLHNTKSECSIASPMEYCKLGSIALTLCLLVEKLID